jgi:tetratricopeptide (TPR) repeat protein
MIFMKQQFSFLHLIKAIVNHSTMHLVFSCILILVLFYPLQAQEEQDSGNFKVCFLDFLYVVDGGYEPYYSFEKNVERHTLLQNMEKEFSLQNGYEIKTEALTVLRGSMDYLENGVKEETGHDVYTEYDLAIWGVVQPVSWPTDYDMILYIFPNSIKYPARVHDFSLRIREGRITKWGKYSCDLPEKTMSAIPQIVSLKYIRSEVPEELNKTLEELFTKNLKKIPFDIRKSLINEALTKQTAGRSIIGYMQLELDRDRHIILDLNARIYKQVQQYLYIDQPLRWPLQQSSMIMPDIAIELNNENANLSTERLVNSGFNYTTDKYLVGLLPFENESDISDNDWIGYGFEYLLEYKLSGISDFRLLDKDFVINSLRQLETTSVDTSRIRFESGERTLGFNLGISGKYTIDEGRVTTDIYIINTLDGDTVSFFRYREDMDELIKIMDRFVRDFLVMTEIYSSTTERRHIANRFTSSVDAFESFCRGRLEAQKAEKDYDKIITYFTDAITKDSQFWEAYYNLGVAFYNAGNNEQALKTFTALIDLFPYFEKPFIERGRVYERLGEIKPATNDFQTAIRIAPSNYRGYYYLGKLYVLQKRYTDAVKMLQQAAILKPGSAEILYQLGNAYYAQHQHKRALPFFEKAMKDMPDNLVGQQKLGECFYHVHNFKAARATFEKVLGYLPDNAEANFMYGITIYKQAILDDFITAFLEMFQLDLRSQANTRKEPVDPAGDRAKILREMIKRFKKAYLAKNDFYEATFNLAMTYSEIGRMDSAITYYKKTIEINPESAKAHLMLAKTYEKRFQRQRALEKYKDVLKLEPTYFINDPTLGREYHNVNLVQLVVSELESEVKENPENIDANLSLARIYYAQGFYGKAANLSRRVLAINPDNANAKKILAQVGRI